ncbi:MAG: methylated-DNA-[protein]-cysteine S-methyltransferase [Acidobacteriota bacterium]|nr:methylated-DNA-[protein]-cysteine S-methyltransferase [Acidobacteriota bacterium]
MTRYASMLDTPIGALTLVVNEEGALVRCTFAEDAWPQDATRDDARCAAVATQLTEYFAGTRREFDIPLALEGTEFQRAVWTALLDIPYGTTTTYGELARRIGRPSAVRAVGAANGANPIPVIVPCHRVIGSNGTLTGYGGGLPRKQQLLALEQQRDRLF